MPGLYRDRQEGLIDTISEMNYLITDNEAKILSTTSFPLMIRQVITIYSYDHLIKQFNQSVCLYSKLQKKAWKYVIKTLYIFIF